MLEDEIERAVFGHLTTDVLQMSVALVLQCIVQLSRDKPQALEGLGAAFTSMICTIDDDYENLKASVQKVGMQ